MNECWNCGYRIPGSGCTKESRTKPIRVKDHDTCGDWVQEFTAGTISAEELQKDNSDWFGNPW